MNIFIDSDLDDTARRATIYDGSIFVYSPCPSALKLCNLAREMTEKTFYPHDPRRLTEHLPAEHCAEMLATLKPKFIHDPRAKKCIQGILAELGCDLEKTYFDVPRLRTAFPGEYLKSGIAYAFHPHRDTWYSAPLCQVNWWMPVYPVSSDNCMAFHLGYWQKAVKNGSRNYNYAKWNEKSRHTAAQHVKSDTRVQPKPEESIELDPQLRLICKVGGLFLFSAAHLHSTVPNISPETRYSIDFRTVHLDDVWARSGAANLDSACTGTTMRDYLQGKDLSHIPEEAIAPYDNTVAP